MPFLNPQIVWDKYVDKVDNFEKSHNINKNQVEKLFLYMWITLYIGLHNYLYKNNVIHCFD